MCSVTKDVRVSEDKTKERNLKGLRIAKNSKDGSKAWWFFTWVYEESIERHDSLVNISLVVCNYASARIYRWNEENGSCSIIYSRVY